MNKRPGPCLYREILDDLTRSHMTWHKKGVNVATKKYKYFPTVALPGVFYSTYTTAILDDSKGNGGIKYVVSLKTSCYGNVLLEIIDHMEKLKQHLEKSGSQMGLLIQWILVVTMWQNVLEWLLQTLDLFPKDN